MAPAPDKALAVRLLTVWSHPPMSPHAVTCLIEQSLRNPGSKRLGVLSFCAPVFPQLSPFCASFGYAQSVVGVGELLGMGPILKQTVY